MRDNPFSYDAISDVYDRENRKGGIDLSCLPEDYKDIIGEVHEKKQALAQLWRASVKKMDDDAKAAHYELIDSLKTEIRDVLDRKDTRLCEILRDIEKRINIGTYKYEIEFDEYFYSLENKESFHVKGASLETLIYSKLLCAELSHSFKVKAANRHHIMACIKKLLVTDKHFYIIRTDIQNFFESIPHSAIRNALVDNTFLSNRTKGCICSILKQYDALKKSGSKGIGVPRGVAMSSYLSEIVMREFDMFVKSKPNVIFYARYVDDIFIVLSHVMPGTTLNDFFTELSDNISKYQLSFHPEGSGKTSLVEYNGSNTATNSIEYLGYSIQLNTGSKNIIFSLSRKRYDRLKSRLGNAFHHFQMTYLYNPRKARKDLVDSLNLLSGNVCLHKSKHGIMTGLHYTNNLLSEECTQMASINKYYQHGLVDRLSLDVKPFGDVAGRDSYLARLKKILGNIDFEDRRKFPKVYSFSVQRMRELSLILG